jgi:hypothetical protein
VTSRPSVAPVRDAVVVDAHVHIHDCYPLAHFFDRAHANLASAVPDACGPGSPRAILLMTEAEPDDWFSRLGAAARSASGQAELSGAGAWSFATTHEACTLRAFAPGKELLVVSGRQVACAEDLEVLTLCSLGRIPDGLPIEDTLARAREIDALPVIPWGPGKWLGARGKLLSRIIAGARPGELFLGDESSRPFFWGTPRHFDEARARGLAVLPGTDPLPFPYEGGRAGSFGFSTRMLLDPAHPAASLKAHLRTRDAEVKAFGRLEGPVRFVRNQIGMQLRKRRRKRVA